ncbi:replication initiation regulator SeqA [Idiomarina tyrosinivorans]|uniref:Negative modulator of initiation of replication n=1 Tax=Idiomarina tyrosinivorans TaxID=1445662 RepID=A0A432ZU53_9GAMM|nr:replication initiation regulator SeqA [Idiomarina tyrosinivorans]RUO81475.1 replication initiation regulator SeqA [Idiomarina tyrosinivorans]
MKRIEVEDDVYAYIASHTQQIGESASTILRRLLNIDGDAQAVAEAAPIATSDSIFNRITVQDMTIEKSVVGRFLYILSTLYRCHSDSFEKVLGITGRDRQYFATSEQALLTSGNSTNPKPIPDSPFWVITNTNTTKKKSMLTQVAKELGYSAADAERIREFL